MSACLFFGPCRVRRPARDYRWTPFFLLFYSSHTWSLENTRCEDDYGTEYTTYNDLIVPAYVMSTALRLPPGLLDLTLSRVYARAPSVVVRPWRGCETVLRRHGHGAAALAHQTSLDHVDYGALSYYSA